MTDFFKRKKKKKSGLIKEAADKTLIKALENRVPLKEEGSAGAWAEEPRKREITSAGGARVKENAICGERRKERERGEAKEWRGEKGLKVGVRPCQ